MRKFIVTIEGKSYEVGVEEVAAGESVKYVQTEAPVRPVQAAAAPASAAVNGEKLLSPFPGLIKKFLANEGDTVKKDQPVLILEAMKMDNDITAPCDGKISFKTEIGSNVETNALLAVIG